MRTGTRYLPSSRTRWFETVPSGAVAVIDPPKGGSPVSRMPSSSRSLHTCPSMYAPRLWPNRADAANENGAAAGT
ncbi:MAG: hypothetical protein IPK72_17680 [Candidatus Eisenbacteria bacterium]|nr:hypothetical protein [Candidatus Eisenbacteria bacterium]